MALITEPNISSPDDFYEELIHSQNGLDDDQTRMMNAKLILILANHVGDKAVLSEAIRSALPKEPTDR